MKKQSNKELKELRKKCPGLSKKWEALLLHDKAIMEAEKEMRELQNKNQSLSTGEIQLKKR